MSRINVNIVLLSRINVNNVLMSRINVNNLIIVLTFLQINGRTNRVSLKIKDVKKRF